MSEKNSVLGTRGISCLWVSYSFLAGCRDFRAWRHCFGWNPFCGDQDFLLRMNTVACRINNGGRYENQQLLLRFQWGFGSEKPAQERHVAKDRRFVYRAPKLVGGVGYHDKGLAII